MISLKAFDSIAARAGYWCTLCHLGPDRLAAVLATHFATLKNGELVPVCGKHAEDMETLLDALEKKGLVG